MHDGAAVGRGVTMPGPTVQIEGHGPVQHEDFTVEGRSILRGQFVFTRLKPLMVRCHHREPASWDVPRPAGRCQGPLDIRGRGRFRRRPAAGAASDRAGRGTGAKRIDGGRCSDGGRGGQTWGVDITCIGVCTRSATTVGGRDWERSPEAGAPVRCGDWTTPSHERPRALHRVSGPD